MDWDNLILFITIAFIATMTPGPAILLVSSNSLSYGLKISILTILGNISGLFVMSLLAVLGLTTVILYSAPLFFTVKMIGAIYLVYLGVRLWRFGFSASVQSSAKDHLNIPVPKPHRLYLQGVLLSLSNPKAIAFTTALIPQFINASAPLAPQFFLLVSVFMFLSFSSLVFYGALAIKARNRSSNGRIQRIVGKMFGGAFISSGIALALTTQK